MNSNRAEKSAGSILWHPHQGLWNTRLNTRLRSFPGGRLLVAALVTVDSLLLCGRALGRRLRSKGLLALVRPRLVDRAVYVDCGLHQKAEEARTVHDWFGSRLELTYVGVEASAEHFAHSSAAMKALGDVRLHQVALVGPGHGEDVVRLYKHGGSGVGDSLFSARGEEFEEVPARRLSELLQREGVGTASGTGPAVVIRMNIEGAEKYVIEDLIEANMVPRIAGFYGMWDDLAKIDPEMDEAFRATLDANGIHPFTFNARDLRHGLRRWAIRYDLTTSFAR